MDTEKARRIADRLIQYENEAHQADVRHATKAKLDRIAKRVNDTNIVSLYEEQMAASSRSIQNSPYLNWWNWYGKPLLAFTIAMSTACIAFYWAVSP